VVTEQDPPPPCRSERREEDENPQISQRHPNTEYREEERRPNYEHEREGKLETEGVKKRISSETISNVASNQISSQIDESDRKIIEETDQNINTEPTILFINENKLYKSPVVELSLGNGKVIKAILDTGSEINLLTENVYLGLKESGIEIPTLPVESVVLITAFGKKSNKIRKQALVEFSLGKDEFEANFLISPQLINEAILGCQCMKEYGIGLNFETEKFTYVRGNQIIERPFHKPQNKEEGNLEGLNVQISNPSRNLKVQIY
jgi:hypothetical protein